ncbi:MAG: hypothetical protein V7752_14125 [Halopseudomonas sp.]
MPQPATNKRRMWLLLIACGLLLSVSLWLGNSLRQQLSSNEQLFAPLPCATSQLQQGCRAVSGEQQVNFFIDSAEIGSHAPMDIRVDLQGFSPQRVELELQGRDMYMGQLRVALQQGDDAQYRVTAQLPVCTTGIMTWRARILITEATGLSGSWFDFEAR